jgi:hypothetical protein
MVSGQAGFSDTIGIQSRAGGNSKSVNRCEI